MYNTRTEIDKSHMVAIITTLFEMIGISVKSENVELNIFFITFSKRTSENIIPTKIPDKTITNPPKNVKYSAPLMIIFTNKAIIWFEIGGV